MSVQNPDRVVTKQDLKDFYDEISPYLGGGGGGGTYTAGDGINIDENNEISADSMQSGEMDDIVTPLPSVRKGYHKYSTEEQVVGEWIDGKPLYEKSYEIDLSTFSTIDTSRQWVAVKNITDTNLEYGFILSGFIYKAEDNTQFPLTSIANGSTNPIGYNTLTIGKSSNLVKINMLSEGVSFFRSVLGLTGCKMFVTIRYTKTTDTANS